MATLRPVVAYSYKQNAAKAVSEAYPNGAPEYSLQQTSDGWFYPVFVGKGALQAQSRFPLFRILIV